MDDKSNACMQDFIQRMTEQAEKEQAEYDALPEEIKEQMREKERKEREAEERKALLASYDRKGISPRYYDATWENWVADTEPKKKALAAVREAWTTNLFLCGKNGTGKTHLAMCLAKDGATYRRLPDLFREVRRDLDEEQNIINHYGSVKLLVIDEIGRQKYSPWEVNLFFEIIDKRWNNMLPTTLITNLSDQEFAEEYGLAVIDRLRPRKVPFNWESKRRELSLALSPEKKPREDIDF